MEKVQDSRAPGQADEQADEQYRRHKLAPQAEHDHQADHDDGAVHGDVVHLPLVSWKVVGPSRVKAAARQYVKGQSQR